MSLDEFAEIEEKRKRALTSQNSLEYSRLCDSQCITPEDQELYDQGLAERAHLAVKNQKLEQEAQRQVGETELLKYRTFIKKAGEIGLNLNDFNSSSQTKYNLLADIFPKRFGRNGTQNLSDYTPGQIGVVFKNVYRSAETKIVESRR